MSRRPVVLLLLVLATAIGLGPDAAAEDASAAAPAGEEERYTPIEVLGLQVAIDRETGQLRPPTRLEREHLARGMQALFSGVQPNLRSFELPDGTVGLELDLALLDFAVAKVLPDGSVAMNCVDGAEPATEWLAAAPPTLAPEER